MEESPGIVPREGPRLFDADIPRYWLGGDPFKTRFFEAMSLTFPDGERYFIDCVRGGRAPSPSLASGLRSVQVIAAAQESARLARPVTLAG